jgi:hypothetical protein
MLPVAGRRSAFIFMADVWRPNNPIDGRYVWLPIHWHNGLPVFKWGSEWDLSVFERSEFSGVAVSSVEPSRDMRSELKK